MGTMITKEFIRKIPKTDLHLHLDGSLRLSTLIELAKDQGVSLPSYTEAGLCETIFKEKYANLIEYLEGFRFTTAVMSTPEAIERVTFELVEDIIAEGVRYAEIRFAPQLHICDNMPIEKVVHAVSRGIEHAKSAFNKTLRNGNDIPFECGIIVCAMRSFNKYMGSYYANLLRNLSNIPKKDVYALASLELARSVVHFTKEDGLPIVGFDIAGQEAGYPAVNHKTAYQYLHNHFILKTVHAGESYGPESIFQAITECHANRIGHGTHLFAKDKIADPEIEEPAVYVNALAEYIANQRIPLEVCLTSNMQTIPEIEKVSNHPIGKMIEHNLAVSICTDNRLVSHTSVSRELELLVSNFNVGKRELKNIVLAGFKGAFYPGSYNEKRNYVRQVINRYKMVEQEESTLKD